VVGERPVDLKAQARGLAGQHVEKTRRHQAGHAAAGIEHHVEWLDDLRIDEGHDLLDVGIQQAARLEAAGSGGGRWERAGRDHVADVADAGITGQRKRFRA
jgi:hypothetical protein